MCVDAQNADGRPPERPRGGPLSGGAPAATTGTPYGGWRPRNRAGKLRSVYRSSRLSPARRASRPAPTIIRGNSSGQTQAGIALLLSAAGDGRVVVGNAVDHADPAVEVLLMHSVGGSDAAAAHWQVEPPTAQCMLLGLGGFPGDTGADNRVVLEAETAPLAATEQVDARLLVVS